MRTLRGERLELKVTIQGEAKEGRGLDRCRLNKVDDSQPTREGQSVSEVREISGE